MTFLKSIVANGARRDRFAPLVAVWGPRAVAAASVMLLTSGCATVTSNALAPAFPADSGSAGLTYFLPKRLVRLTVTRAPTDISKLIAVRDAKKAELVAAQASLDEAKTKRDAASALLDAIAVASARRSQLQGDLEQAEAAVTVALKAVTDAQDAYQVSIDAVRDAPVGGKGCAFTAKLELLAVQPDPDFRFVARLTHNWLRDDTTKLGVNASGLLSSANAVAADRTGDIIAEGAGAMAALGGGEGGRFASQSAPPPTQGACEKGQVIRIFDPASQSEVAQASLDAQQAGYPFQVIANSSAPPSSVQQNAAFLVMADRLQRNRSGAIFYRSPVPITLTLLDGTDGKSWRVAESSIVLIPQAGPISYVPMNSSAFVKTVDDVQFSDGAVTSWSTDRPSEVLEIIRLPVKVATAVIQIPTQLFSLRVDYSTKDKALIEAQQAEIAQRQQMLKLRQCLDQAKDKGSDPTPCLPPST